MIKQIQDALVDILKNTQIVATSQCSILTQTNTFQRDLADAINTEIGFCFAVLFNKISYEGVHFDNVDMPPVATYNFTISVIHKADYTSGYKTPIELLDEMLRIHNTEGRTNDGADFHIKLVENPVAFILANPYHIYEIEINVKTY